MLGRLCSGREILEHIKKKMVERGEEQKEEREKGGTVEGVGGSGVDEIRGPVLGGSIFLPGNTVGVGLRPYSISSSSRSSFLEEKLDEKLGEKLGEKLKQKEKMQLVMKMRAGEAREQFVPKIHTDLKKLAEEAVRLNWYSF